MAKMVLFSYYGGALLVCASTCMHQKTSSHTQDRLLKKMPTVLLQKNCPFTIIFRLFCVWYTTQGHVGIVSRNILYHQLVIEKGGIIPGPACCRFRSLDAFLIICYKSSRVGPFQEHASQHPPCIFNKQVNDSLMLWFRVSQVKLGHWLQHFL